MKEIKPTYVLVSPYFLRNSKWIHFVAQHGSLILAIEMLVCMLLSNFICEGDLWIGYLLLFTFFTFFYIVNHDLTNEKLLLMQTVSTYIIAICIVHFQFFVNDGVQNQVYFRKSHLFLQACQVKPFIYPIFLQLVHRKFYTNDTSTPERTSKLNKYDCYHFLLFCGSWALVVFTVLLRVYFVYFTLPNDNLERRESFKNFCIYYTGLVIFCDVCFFLLVLWIVHLYMGVSHSNLINASTTEEVQYDSEGRAWHCVFFRASKSELGFNDCKASISILLKQCYILPRTLFDKKPHRTGNAYE